MMRLSKICKNILPATMVLALGLTSCKKMMDVETQDVLESKNMYQNVYDADAAVMGIYGKFVKLADRLVVLNELRADLMTTTANADANLRQLNEHNVTVDNPYANPRPFYEVILNCNDVLANLDIMLRDKKLKVEQYNQRYSDIAALRSWLYLQLGIQYGRVPYITSPLATTADLSVVSQMPRLELGQLVDTLTRTMEALPFQAPYPAGTSLLTTVDGYTTNKFFINKQVVLGQLYLWKNDYHNAAIALKKVMEAGGTGDLYTNRLTGASKADNNDLAVSYVRYREEDENMLVDNNTQGWRSIFARSEDKLFGYEWIWYLPFDQKFSPTNPFTQLFSNVGGSYLLKPSQLAIDNWNSQTQKNDFSYDARGKVFSWRLVNGQPVIVKYLYNAGITTDGIAVNNGRWFLYRAASLHLDFAEAANRDNHQSLAYALVNQGLTTIPNRITNEAAPYDFDARKSDNPKIVGDWCLNSGIRGRANLYSFAVSGDSTQSIEDGILNESALETAYEGRRWADLVRIALRRGDAAFLANRIADKLKKENNPAAENVRTKLQNRDNWFLPFRWQ